MNAPTLFDQPQNTPERPADFWEFLEDYCRRVTGKPTWKLFKIDRITNGTLCDGCVPTTTYQSGPRKGKWKYSESTSSQVVLSNKEEDAEKQRYSETTGRCYGCFGRATRVVASGTRDGVPYQDRKPCPDCKGTGKHTKVVK